jgi:4-amino-4-deoxy-L-arabinose transferase-like glycosyltransferase
LPDQTIELKPTTLRIVQGLALLLVAFKLVQLSTTGIFQDEAYYWMWGQHPALSYYDHPPLNAWLLGLSSLFLGWNSYAVRLPVALSFLADIAALYLLSRRLAGPSWQAHFSVTLLLLLTVPMYWLVTSMALPDHLLLAGCLFALAFFCGFFIDRARGEGGRSRDLYLGALFLGLAGLAKYNAAFLAIALGLYVLFADRALLRQPRLYLAAGLTLVLQLPVVVWNATENFASWEFILHGRHAGLRMSYDGVISFVGGILILLSPFLIIPAVRFAAGRTPVAGAGFARIAFVVSSLVILAVSFATVVLFHWNLVAYAAMLPFLAFVLRPRWLLAGQALWGTAFAIAATINYALVPLTDVRGWRDEATAWAYGWGPTAQAVTAARAAHKVGFVAAPDYTTASLLGFALKDRDVVSLSPNRDEYDYWFDSAAHAGEDAILFSDDWRPLRSDISSRFTRLTLLASLDVVVEGKLLDTHKLYLATDYRPND